jgi:hypothetical protein
MMSIGTRSRWILARYSRPLAVVLAVVGILALGGAFLVYSTPPTEQVTETVYDQQVRTETTTAAVVTGETDLYSEGETLEDSPVYFFGATPTVILRTVTDVPEGEEVTVTQRVTLQHRASRNGEVFWSTERLLSATEERTSSGSVRTESTVDMRAVNRTAADRRAEIGLVGRFDTLIRVRVAYETANYSEELTATMPVTLVDQAYWFEGSAAANRTHTETTTREVTGSPDITLVGGLGLLGVVALIAAARLGAVSRRGVDIDAIETELTRTRYEEWISRGDLPTSSEKQFVGIDTLEDLVDIAIDSNKRVIYDEEFEAYGVVDSDVVYYYVEREEFEQWMGV